jgi:hypothetical protein
MRRWASGEPDRLWAASARRHRARRRSDHHPRRCHQCPVPVSHPARLASPRVQGRGCRVRPGQGASRQVHDHQVPGCLQAHPSNHGRGRVRRCRDGGRHGRYPSPSWDPNLDPRIGPGTSGNRAGAQAGLDQQMRRPSRPARGQRSLWLSLRRNARISSHFIHTTQDIQQSHCDTGCSSTASWQLAGNTLWTRPVLSAVIQRWHCGHQNTLRPSSSAVTMVVAQIRHGSPARRYT